MLKPRSKADDSLTKKVACMGCGRKVIVKRAGFEIKTFRCATCETLGEKELKKSFLELNKSSDKTIFT